ncbi:hypothetical protein BJ684DRAFT_19336 [Piptocephalis cylindrospora]|uniref:Methyltransferase type 11 domain-containing protein n=1 Tax=Piptocephalis cylindrospora TaxID=1907219 RepID=A0A4P9Y644_9FUNG|nr:hypothetical protein BJ684DRAFT_19336 [Piptocephalis cylindrospora]|eukprot:RKP14242.1 hypothetical protein BJ684DRAFT_19336 [Piptocephalis cylindrospora]
MNAAWIDSTDQKSSKFRIPWLKRRAASHHSLQLPTEGIFDPQNADAVEKNRMANDAISFTLRKVIFSPVFQPKCIVLVIVGPSSWPRNVASAYPSSQIIVLNASHHVIREGELGEEEDPLPENMSLRFFDVKKDSADVVAVRSLLRVAPSPIWMELVRECVRITKPGGWIENIDTDYLRGNPGFPSLVANSITKRAMARRGIDISLSHNAHAVLGNLHCTNVRTGCVDIPVGPWGGILGEIQAKVATRFLALFRQSLEAEGDQQSIDEFDQVYPAWLQELESSETYNRYFITYGQPPNPVLGSKDP